jgi:hypothetical protein
VGADLAQGEWFRRTKAGGMFAVAKHYSSLGTQVGQRTVHITCDPTTLECICQPEGMREPFRRPIVHRTKDTLLGELARFHEIPAYQLMRPFDPVTWRARMYTQLMCPAPSSSCSAPSLPSQRMEPHVSVECVTDRQQRPRPRQRFWGSYCGIARRGTRDQAPSAGQRLHCHG